MLKVLIADDEQLICQMIRKMIDWEGAELVPAGMAHNGFDVLEEIREKKPDIVITDIRMPGLTGLELIEEALKIDPSLDFIIISGYKSFDYAHQALTLGVRHYLLKPIDRTELTQALEQISLKRRESELNRMESRMIAVQKETYRRNARQHFLNSILEDNGMETAVQEAPEEERLEFSEARYLAFFAKIDWTDEGEVAQGLLELLQALIEKEEAENWHCEYVSTRVKSGIISVVNYPPGAKEAHPEDMEALFTKCRRETDKFAGCSVTFGVGSEKGRIEETRVSIDEAVKAVKYRIRAGLCRVIFYEDLRRCSEDISGVLTDSIRSGNRRAIEALDAQAVRDDLQLLYEELRTRPDYSPLQLYRLIEEMSGMVCQVLDENAIGPELLSEFSGAVELLMDRSTTEARMIQRFQDMVEQFFRCVLEMRRMSGQAPIREAKVYLDGHFRENPTLEEVAEAVGMSATYLSSLFKKELGIGFSDYLIQLRLEEAKRLLRTTKEPLTAVSEEVGYQDAKYFSRIFRKTVGIKPSEYRKLYQ